MLRSLSESGIHKRALSRRGIRGAYIRFGDTLRVARTGAEGTRDRPRTWRPRNQDRGYTIARSYARSDVKTRVASRSVGPVPFNTHFNARADNWSNALLASSIRKHLIGLKALITALNCANARFYPY